MRGMTFTTTEKLVTEDCCKCGVLFALPYELQTRLREKHDTFYCPNGHGQSYTDKTEAELQRERADRLANQIKHVGHRLEAERRSHSATKGQLTKTKKRIANGVCPCCNRSFANLGRHMSNQHPDFVKHEEA